MSVGTEVINVKIVLIGESGVGKTCILSRFVNDMFDGNSLSTNGASYAAKTLRFEEKNASIQMQLWDTAGQEKFKSIARMFYKDATVAILVYDITRKDSYDGMVNYWYKELRDNGPDDIIIAVAANKSDLYTQEKVPEMEVREFAQKIGAIFRNTSAMTSDGIDDLFVSIGKKILDPNYKDDAVDSNGSQPDTKASDNQRINNKKKTLKLDQANKGGKKKKKCCLGGKEGGKKNEEKK